MYAYIRFTCRHMMAAYTTGCNGTNVSKQGTNKHSASQTLSTLVCLFL